MIPDFANCTGELLIAFHSRIAELLIEEDSLPSGSQKAYHIREFNDWRQCADEFERIMTSRAIAFNPIDWST